MLRGDRPTANIDAVPTTLAALGVAVLAVLPGAAYTFAFESRVGPLKARASDRVVRFLAASATFHAVFAGLTYYLYRTEILSGRLTHGKINPWLIELAAILYVLVPWLIGWAVGGVQRSGRPSWVKTLVGSWHPRAWDYVFTEKGASYVRLRMKSGTWIAGTYAQLEGQLGAYASGYGEEPDLYLNPGLTVDPDTGEFETDTDGNPVPNGCSVLVRWDEVEYAQFIP
jgi:hypothetical protein